MSEELAEELPPAAAEVTAAPFAVERIALIAVALLLLLLLALFFLRRRGPGGGARGKTVVLLGPCGAGKTALFHRLRFGRVVPSVSSMTTATASCALPRAGGSGTRAVAFADVPGSGRLRQQLLTQTAGAAALVCVLDGTQLIVQAKEAAGVLYDVLASEALAERPPPLLLAVNKCDAAGAANPAAARRALEVEIQRVRMARTTMGDTSEKLKRVRGIADDSAGPFNFDQLGCAFECASVSAVRPELGPLHSFVNAHVR